MFMLARRRWKTAAEMAPFMNALLFTLPVFGQVELSASNES